MTKYEFLSSLQPGDKIRAEYGDVTTSFRITFNDPQRRIISFEWRFFGLYLREPGYDNYDSYCFKDVLALNWKKIRDISPAKPTAN